jgi:hypothetical protein
MQGLDAAQRQYDNQAPEDDMEPHRRDFNDYIDTHLFIEDFSCCEGDVIDWLEDRGIRDERDSEKMELLRRISTAFCGQSCGESNVGLACGDAFYRIMRRLALIAYNAE